MAELPHNVPLIGGLIDGLNNQSKDYIKKRKVLYIQETWPPLKKGKPTISPTIVESISIGLVLLSI